LQSSWRGFAHTSHVRDQFEQFFQLKAKFLLTELFSPFITPFVLLWCLRPKSLELIDFFRNFTVSVVGVGDVCSFAQMDVRKHGNPDWQPADGDKDDTPGDGATPTCDTNNYTQGEHGKTELSLVHFTLTNPQWKMPTEARQFVQGIRRNAMQDLNRARGTFGGLANATAMGQSLMSVESMGGEYASIINSVLQNNQLSNSQQIGMSVFNAPPAYFQQPGAGAQQQQQQQPQANQSSSSLMTNDFERMLQQNLSDASSAMPMRGTFLHNISEDDDQQQQQPQESVSAQPRPMMMSSLRGGMSRREGPAEGSQGGLLHR
jgi:autophagy-related protein 9